jgi:hypothetical protein
MNIGDIVGGIVSGILGLGGDIISTAVGAVMTFVGSVVNALAALADHAISILPDATDLGLSVPSGWIYGYTFLNTFLPVSEALAMVGIFTAIVVGGILFRLAVTVYHLIPKPFVGT